MYQSPAHIGFHFSCPSHNLLHLLPQGEAGHRGPDGNPGRDGARVSYTLLSLMRNVAQNINQLTL